MSSASWTRVEPRRRVRFRGNAESGGASVRGRARACPPSYRGRDPPLTPNQPAPPRFRGSRHKGPVERSYADVVRGSRHRGRPPFGDSRSGSRSTTREPTGENTSGLRKPADAVLAHVIRTMFKTIKIVHHLNNLLDDERGSANIMLDKKVRELSTHIKPALPTDDILLLLSGNAKQWGIFTKQTLEEHYTHTLQTLLDTLGDTHFPDWPEALAVAERWAVRNFPRITENTMDQARTYITNYMSQPEVTRERTPPPPPPPPPPPQPARSTAVPRSPSRAPITRPARVPNIRTAHNSAPRTSRPSHTVPSPTILDWSAPPRESQTAPGAVRNNAAERPLRTVTHEPRAGASPPGATAPPPRSPRSSPLASTGSEPPDLWVHTPPEPLEQRERRTSRVPAVSVDTQRVSQTELAGPSAPVSPPLPFPITFSLLGDAEDPFGTDDSCPSEPETTQGTRGVRRHVTTTRKSRDWELTVTQPILLIGDSNLSRIGQYNYQNVQIDSYPGATFRNAARLINAADIRVQPTAVILSFGLNSRGCDPKSTGIHQMRQAMYAARQRFPHADIRVPLIQYSFSLPLREQRNLIELNEFIVDHGFHISPIPEEHFTTGQDQIHWTRETAHHFLDHWARELKFPSP